MSEQSVGGPTVDALVAKMTKDSVEAAGLDAQTLMMVRIAAMAAVDAPPASYLMNLMAAAELGLDDDMVRSVLIAVAPIVGSVRIVSALSNIEEALDLALGLDQSE